MAKINTRPVITVDNFGQFISGEIIESVIYSDSTFECASVDHTRYITTRFDRVDFDKSEFDFVSFYKTRIQNSEFGEDAEFRDCTFDTVGFVGCTGQPSFTRCKFRNCDLRDIAPDRLIGCDIWNCQGHPDYSSTAEIRRIEERSAAAFR